MVIRYMASKGSGGYRNHYFTHGRWRPIPRDSRGIPQVRWLRKKGAKIIKSEVKSERHISLCGKYAYTQGYRFDYYAAGDSPPFFAKSNETRGAEGGGQIVCWPFHIEE